MNQDTIMVDNVIVDKSNAQGNTVKVNQQANNQELIVDDNMIINKNNAQKNIRNWLHKSILLQGIHCTNQHI